MSADELVELRFMAPRWAVDVIDAKVQAGVGRQPSRNKIAGSVICSWARDEIHVATIVCRVTRGNGIVTPTERDEVGE